MSRANVDELARVLRMIAGLSIDAPMSELKELARAAIADTKPRSPAERAYHVVLRMIVEAPPIITAKGCVETAKTALQVVRDNSNKVVLAWAETYERRIAPLGVDPEAALKNSPFETCMKLAIQRGWPLPASEPTTAAAEWPIRSHWTRLLQKERAEAAGLEVPPIGDPPFRARGTLQMNQRLIITR